MTNKKNLKMRKFTKKEIKKLKKHWKQLQILEDEFYAKVGILEGAIQHDLDIPDLEFFSSDDGYCGIGNMSRTIELIHSDELEGK